MCHWYAAENATMPHLNGPVRATQHLVIARFCVLFLSGTLFEILSGVPHHCHHLSYV